MESICNDSKCEMIKMGIFHKKSEHFKASRLKEIESREIKNKFCYSLKDKTKLIILTCCSILFATLITTSLNILDKDVLGFVIATIMFSYVIFIVGIGPVFKI